MMISPERIRAVANAFRALTYRELEAISLGIADTAGMDRHDARIMLRGMIDWADKVYEQRNPEENQS